MQEANWNQLGDFEATRKNQRSAMNQSSKEQFLAHAADASFVRI
jgi:hypothetical protein